MGRRLETLLGLFQQAHYDAGIFRAWVSRHPAPKDWDVFSEKVALRWTAKARAIYTLAFVSSLGVNGFLPAALVLARRALIPFEVLISRGYAFRVGRRLKKIRLKAVVGITGSFGKTTTKEILASVLEQKFRVHKSPENVNTLLGVSRWVLANNFAAGDILVVEMGAYRRGDVKKMCRMVRPTIGILTGINEAHLERFGTLEKTKAAKSELFDWLRPPRQAFFNKDSKLVSEAVRLREPRWQARRVALTAYGASGTSGISIAVSELEPTAIRVRVRKLSSEAPWSFDARVRLIGEHHLLSIAAAAAAADFLGLSGAEIQKGLERVQPILRRLASRYTPAGRLVIDDSYNITLDGLRAAIAALRRIHERKIGVFAGIAEAGPAQAQANETLGRLIAPEFDVILLRKTPVAEHVRRGLDRAGWDKSKLIWYNETGAMEQILGHILQPGDCVYLSAYDWPAIYL